MKLSLRSASVLLLLWLAWPLADSIPPILAPRSLPTPQDLTTLPTSIALGAAPASLRAVSTLPTSREIIDRSVPISEILPEARIHLRNGTLSTTPGPAGRVRRFVPGYLLVGFRGREEVRALRVEPGSEESESARAAAHPGVLFAEVDALMERQARLNDPELPGQWHHQKVGSSAAWDLSFGSPLVKVAIVDLPFQMDHPDLAPHVLPGWDVVTGLPITADSGDQHSTLGAGLAAAVLNNGLGGAGMGNLSILPINISGFISEMYTAIRWAADQGVRVVNLSWDGAYSSTLDTAGAYLREKTRGMVVMAGINDETRLPYVNRPNIYAIALTDRSDVQRSSHGPHVDFAAPGWDVLSTSVNSSYASDSGTSFSAPIFAGVVAMMMSINPLLEVEEIEQILRNTSVDLGDPGPDEFYGWGRIDFGRAATEAYRRIRLREALLQHGEFSFSFPRQTNMTYSVLRSMRLDPPDWQLATDEIRVTNGDVITIRVPAQTPAFFQVRGGFPF